MTMITQRQSLIDMITGVCRLCLKSDVPMSSIFTTNITENDNLDVLAARITSIAQVQVDRSDGLPETICHSCRHRVDKFHDFRLLIEISDRTLRSCFDEVRRKSDCERIAGRSTEEDDDEEYQEFSEDAVVIEKDRLPANAIFVPSVVGMQVWQICNMKEDTEDEDEAEIVDENKPDYETLEDTANSYRDLACTMELDNSDVDDYEGVKRCLAQSVASLSGETIRDREEKPYLLTSANETKDTDEDEIECTDEKIHGSIDEDEDYDEVNSKIDGYSCQLCLKSFRALDALKYHVSDHFSDGTRSNSREIVDAQSEKRKSDAPCVSARDEDPKPNETTDDDNEPDIKMETPDSPLPRSLDEVVEATEDGFVRKPRNLNVKGFKCRHCEKIFTKLSTRNYHQEINHRTRRYKTHKCNECDEEFVDRNDLVYHKTTHAPPVCNICNKKFRSVQSFKMHWRRHTHGSRYNCSVCGKSYYTSSELARHAQQHTGLRGYPCDLCNMSFMSKPELNRHNKYHNGVKKWECKICLKTYYESGHLKVHERVHTGERPFACTICQKGFITKSKLSRHLKIHNGPRQSRNFVDGIE